MISFLHIVKWFQILLFNSNNLTLVICLRTVLFDPMIGPQQVLLLQVRADQGAMAMKGVLYVPEISRAAALPSDGLMSYPVLY